MTLEKFLKLSQDKQALEVAKFVNPGPWKHEWVYAIGQAEQGLRRMCSKCKIGYCIGSECPVPNKVKVDWNLAKELQGECGDDFWPNLVCMHYGLDLVDFDLWAVLRATPTDYIAACMAAKNYFEKEQ